MPIKLIPRLSNALPVRADRLPVGAYVIYSNHLYEVVEGEFDKKNPEHIVLTFKGSTPNESIQSLITVPKDFKFNTIRIEMIAEGYF